MKLWDNSQSKARIGADIPISLYILNNIRNTKKRKTQIQSILKRKKLNYTGESYLDTEYSIPLAYHSIFEKIRKKIKRHPELKLIFHTKTVKCDKTKIPLPIEYGADDMYGIDTYRIKDGYFVKKMINIHPHHHDKKLIIANKSSLVGAMIDNGRLGLVGSDKFYILGKKLKVLREFFKSPLCTMIAQFTKYRQDFLEKDAFGYIPDIRSICDKFDKEFIYKYFRFTDEEIKSINEMK